MAGAMLASCAPSARHCQPDIQVLPARAPPQSAASPPPISPGAVSGQAFILNQSRFHHSLPAHSRTTSNTFVKPVNTLFAYFDILRGNSPLFLFPYSERNGLIQVQEDRRLLTTSTIHHFRHNRTHLPSYSTSYISISQRNQPWFWRHLVSQINDGDNEMTTTAASAPGSPPDLSGSRSSKSSSYCSTSQFSSPDGILSDVSNFEDIGLEDERDASRTPSPTDRANIGQKSDPPRPLQITDGPKPPGGPMRANNIAIKPVFPSLKGQVRSAVGQSARDPLQPGKIPRNSRRGFTSPSVPVFSASGFNAELRTRSTSPARRVATSVASSSTSSLRTIPGDPRSSLPLPPPRRGSWQPNRKSIQELEAEYHDSDDELPDEAHLWNVPMSPRPPEERCSPISSHRGSPDRSRGSRSPRPIPLAHAVTAPESPPAHLFGSKSLPKNRPPPPRSSSLQMAISSPSSPTSPRLRSSLRATRAKSWTFAMAELSEEAKILSEALEYHAESAERKREEMIQKGHSKRSSLDTLSNRSSTIQLPPVQKGNLDFMPISREKEAILSRTRPSWLPPKDPREERRHLREYQRMMAASIEAEKRKEDRLYMQRCQKDDTREALSKIWEEYISPGRDALDSDDRVRHLWWRGVSPKVRGQVWERTIGNQLSLTATSYDRALRRAKDIQARKFEDLSETEKSMIYWFKDIERDAETAFPELNLFQMNGPLRQDLVDVCEAYACYRSDVGYLYGVQLISALLLLQLHSPSAVFILLANCLNRPMPLAFLTNDLGATSRTYGLAISTLAIKFPRLHIFLFGSRERGGLEMSGEAIFEPMFRTLFSNGLDVDRLSRVWDVWVFEGDRTLIRAAVALLGSMQAQIFDIPGSLDLKRRNIQELLGWGPYGRRDGYWNLTSVGDQDGFVEEVREAGKLDYTGK